MPTGLYQLDPTKDPRWGELAQKHPKSSVFHTVGWLKALQSTYGYEPVAYTTSPPTSELANGIVFCRVQSWLTGHRLVSLPFSDHCEPLCEPGDELNWLICSLQNLRESQNLKYLELRPIRDTYGNSDEKSGFKPSSKFFLHNVNLEPAEEELFQSLDKDCVQRRIRRAERADLTEKVGRSEAILRDFYELFVTTRRRHQIPPIPYRWFENLSEHLRDDLEVRVSFMEKVPIAAILTLRFRNAVYYKYGCSDSRFHRYAATPWLLWRSMLAAKSGGAKKFDLGRTEANNAGLLTFKDHWTTESSPLLYWKFPGKSFIDTVDGWKLNMAKRIFSCMPNAMLKLTGRVVYRHIG
jgi:hypothetical protein